MKRLVEHRHVELSTKILRVPKTQNSAILLNLENTEKIDQNFGLVSCI